MMAVRNSMVELIDTLRGFAHAGTSDFTIGSQSYWSDEQLQRILDRYRTDIRDAQLIYHPVKGTDNELDYKEFSAYAKFWESTIDGTSRFVITDVEGAVVSDYSVDYENGIVTFDDDQGAVSRFLTGHSYDIYAAAADVWEQKAAYHAEKIDFSTDGHNVKRSHIITHCEKMVQKYNAMSINGGSSSGDVIRGDYNGS